MIVLFAIVPLRAEDNSPKMMTSSPTAKLYRVDEGLFDIKLGEVLDLTDRKVLFSFPAQSDDNKREYIRKNQAIKLSINSGPAYIEVGKRLDLKRMGETRAIFDDKSECYMDLIGLAIPKGAPVIATFRFQCD